MDIQILVPLIWQDKSMQYMYICFTKHFHSIRIEFCPTENESVYFMSPPCNGETYCFWQSCLSVRPSVRLSHFAARITQTPFMLETRNFTGLLPSMSCCAPPYFGLPPFGKFWNIPDKLLKMAIFNFAARVTQKPIKLDCWNFTGLLPNMSCCAPPYFGLPTPCKFWIIPLLVVCRTV